MIRDGDANTIKKINESKPYPDLVVEKRECINHVAKCLGTTLRKVIDDKRKVKITLGENGKGKLTQTKIDKLQKTRAILLELICTRDETGYLDNLQTLLFNKQQSSS